MREPFDFLTASRAAAEIARWAMFHAANKSPAVSSSLEQDLESCAAALGYKLVKAEADADLRMSR